MTATDETTTDRWLTEGTAAWPALDGRDPLVAEGLRRHLARAEEVMFAADLFVATAAAAGQQAAITAVDEMLRQVAVTTRRLLSAADVEDELQAVVTHLLVSDQGRPPAIGEYGGRAPLRAWLRVALVRRALSARRRSSPVEVGEEVWLSLPALETDPMLDALRRRVAPVFREAFEDAFDSLAERGRTLLRQHLLDGLSAIEIGALQGIHRATAHRWITEAKAELLQLLRDELERRLNLRPEEVTTLLRAIQTDLALSVSRILGQRPADREGVTRRDR